MPDGSIEYSREYRASDADKMAQDYISGKIYQLEDFGELDKDLEQMLEQASISTNKNTVPNEQRSPFITSGLRIDDEIDDGYNRYFYREANQEYTLGRDTVSSILGSNNIACSHDDLENSEMISEELTHHHLMTIMQLRLDDILIFWFSFILLIFV